MHSGSRGLGASLRVALALAAKLLLAVGTVAGVVSQAVAVLVGDLGGSLAVKSGTAYIEPRVGAGEGDIDLRRLRREGAETARRVPPLRSSRHLCMIIII